MLRAGEVLDREAERLEDGQLLVGAAALARADQHLAELRADVLRAEPGHQVVAGLVHHRLARVGEQRRGLHGLRVELARGRDRRADGVDVRSRGEPGAVDDRLARGGGRHDDVGVAHGLLGARGGLDRERRLRLGDERLHRLGGAAPHACALEPAERGHRLEVRARLDAGAEDRELRRVRAARGRASRPRRPRRCGWP